MLTHLFGKQTRSFDSLTEHVIHSGAVSILLVALGEAAVLGDRHMVEPRVPDVDEGSVGDATSDVASTVVRLRLRSGDVLLVEFGPVHVRQACVRDVYATVNSRVLTPFHRPRARSYQIYRKSSGIALNL